MPAEWKLFSSLHLHSYMCEPLLDRYKSSISRLPASVSSAKSRNCISLKSERSAVAFWVCACGGRSSPDLSDVGDEREVLKKSSECALLRWPRKPERFIDFSHHLAHTAVTHEPNACQAQCTSTKSIFFLSASQKPRNSRLVYELHNPKNAFECKLKN